MKDEILFFNELKDYGVRWGRSQVDRLERAGKFPRRLAVGTHRVGWLRSEIISHMKVLVAMRSQRIGEIGSAHKIEGGGQGHAPRRRVSSRHEL